MRSGIPREGVLRLDRPRSRSRLARLATALCGVALLATASGCAQASSTVSFPVERAVGASEERGAGAAGDQVFTGGRRAAVELAGADAVPKPPAPTTTTVPVPFAVQISPASGALDVRLDTPVRVEVSGGELVKVEVTTPDGPAAGALHGAEFRPLDGLRFATSYQLTATVRDRNGQVSVHTSAFATMAEADTTEAWLTPETGEVAGIGRPIMLGFRHDVPPEDRAAVLSRLSVVTSPPVAGAWRWISDSDVHWRPLEFWPAHTQVKVNADLGGLSVGGRWLTDSLSTQFNIGDAQRIVIDAAAHTAVAYLNGVAVRTMPISAGREEYPTASGINLVMEKYDDFEMDSSSVGIYGANAYRLWVEDAQRLTNSGTFIHAAPWNGSLGAANLSHGCINASLEDAQWMMDFTRIGDPVEIVNTPERLSYMNGWGHWNLSAQEWLAPQS